MLGNKWDVNIYRVRSRGSKGGSRGGAERGGSLEMATGVGRGYRKREGRDEKGCEGEERRGQINIEPQVWRKREDEGSKS